MIIIHVTCLTNLINW